MERGYNQGTGTPCGRKGSRSPAARLATAPRCGARTRAGKPCRAPAVGGKRRCRLHGGAPGNANALKNGFYTKAAVAERRQLRALLRALGPGLEGMG